MSPTREQKVLAACCHLAYLIVITGVVLPLIVWLWKKDESDFLGQHAWQAFFYQGTLLGSAIVLWVVGYVVFIHLSPFALGVATLFSSVIGLLLLVVLAAPTLVAAWKAGSGQTYDYPVLGRLAHRLLSV